MEIHGNPGESIEMLDFHSLYKHFKHFSGPRAGNAWNACFLLVLQAYFVMPAGAVWQMLEMLEMLVSYWFYKHIYVHFAGFRAARIAWFWLVLQAFQAFLVPRTEIMICLVFQCFISIFARGAWICWNAWIILGFQAFHAGPGWHLDLT